ncbi:hypothetical protein [Streptosporangium sp. NPDC002524]|uniref:hypothetical protein n=1 Tax=Streptosporangium sp. NPDC002524 TaxID=3154537 RepID=UPI00331D5A28
MSTPQDPTAVPPAVIEINADPLRSPAYLLRLETCCPGQWRLVWPGSGLPGGSIYDRGVPPHTLDRWVHVMATAHQPGDPHADRYHWAQITDAIPHAYEQAQRLRPHQ